MTTTTFGNLLEAVPTVALDMELARIVAFDSLTSRDPPNWLFTSGKRNRFNPKEVQCVYFSCSEDVARWESFRGLVGLPCRRQPTVTFWARVRLGKVLDLTDPAIAKALALTQDDLERPWHTVGRPTKTQALGKTVAEKSTIVAIRYPSVAAKAAGKVGANVVIFRNRVAEPDRVEILGSDRKPLQVWP